MINLDEEENISAINSILDRDSRRGLRKLVKLELIKSDKLDARILCLCDYRIFFLTISKNNKPGKVESFFHFFDVKKIESLSTNQLSFTTNDNKEYKIHAYDSSISETSDLENGLESIVTNVDEILGLYCSNLFDVFPSVTIKELVETVNIQPEKRYNTIYKEINETKSLRKKLNLCDSYSKAYTVCCDYNSSSFFQEVVWDVNVIYGKNCLNEFSLNDFDYVKDFYPLIWSLRHNKWFEGFHSEGNKFTNEMQEELIKVLILPSCNLKKLSLIQANLKQDFLNKFNNQLTQSKSKQSLQSLPISNTITNLKSINLSRNPIEDRGLLQFINLFRDQQTSSTHSNLIDLSLSKCSITSKSINQLFTAINFYLLNTFDLSYNNLKEEPTDFFKYLSQPNQLNELNLSNTDIDIDKLFASLSKGGCDSSLKKLILNNNHSFSKFSNNENIIKFLLNTKTLTHLEISNCKLSASLVQTILSSLKHNPNLTNGIHLNLSSNDLGSNIRQFMSEFSLNYSINSVDLSDNNLDVDSDILISQMYQTNIKSLSLNRNFQYSKTKVVTRLIQSLVKWLNSKSSSLEQLWLIDCRLRASLSDLISEMGEFTKLKLLDISGNDLGDFGVSLLSKSLQANRSLETLIFDRSNISLASYQRILDSLKRNYTLKTIQMPINDICILYQKSPDKVVDIVKQMTETLSQRNLLNSTQKCDLNQLFKTKMKLINESNSQSVTQQTLNVSIGSQSSSSSSLPNQSPKNKSSENETDSESLNENESTQTIPSSLKEVLQNLNETSCSYLAQNSIEKQYKKINEDILNKLDEIVVDFEKELVNKLKKTYPKYSNSIQQQHQLNSNQSNTQQNIKQYSVGSDLNKIKSMIKEHTNSMLTQIHNDICEITYNLSLSMAEKVMIEAQQAKSVQLEKKSVSVIDSARTHTTSSETPSAIESLGKKIVGGIKLPFANISVSNSPMSDSPSNQTPGSVQHRLNSKSKRPISSQIYETPVVTQQSDRSVSPSKLLSSSSNENLIENSSDDDILSNKSREKTPDSLNSDETAKISKTPVVLSSSSNSSNLKKETPEAQASIPVPAPRKTKNIVKSLLVNLGVGPVGQKITSPKVGRKLSENKEAEVTTEVVNEVISETKSEETSEQNEDSIQPLQHINKSRPRRANVKRPTTKNPYTNIESELPPSGVQEDKPKRHDLIEIGNSNEQTTEKNRSLSPQPPSNTATPSVPKVATNQVEQPKISLNILENVKLRKTIRNKPPVEEIQNQNVEPLPSVSIGNPSKLGNRFSMFETKQETKSELKNLKKTTETSDLTEVNEEIENNKPAKPLPPVPPVKPPRPVFNPNKLNDATQSNNFVKLRPVSTLNGNSSTTNSTTNNANTNNKLNEINGIKLNTNSNSTGTTSSSSISSSSTSSVTDSRANNNENDKRSSVKEIVQMWPDESKA